MNHKAKRCIPRRLWYRLLAWKMALSDGFGAISYSQEGEDLILRRVFEGRRSGFFVDVGAHHPSRFSNTYYFYKLGWSGINIDATPGSMRLFRRRRPRDINVEAAVGLPGEAVPFFLFEDPALNTLNAATAQALGSGPYHKVGEQTLVKRSLAALLEQHLPAHQVIDFLTVDVEGADLEVLQSNNWRLFRPSWLLVEAIGLGVRAALEAEVNRYLSGAGYELSAKTLNTLIFRRLDHA